MKKHFYFDFRISAIAAITELVLFAVVIIFSFNGLPPALEWLNPTILILNILASMCLLSGYFFIAKNHHLPRLQKLVVFWFFAGLLSIFLPLLRIFSIFQPPPSSTPFYPILSLFMLIKVILWIVKGIILLKVAVELKKLTVYGRTIVSLSRLYRISGWLTISVVGAFFAVFTNLLATAYEVSFFFKANKIENKQKR